MYRQSLRTDAPQQDTNAASIRRPSPIAAGLADAIAIAKGEADPSAYRVHVPADIDVLRIRRNMGLTREAFAMRFGPSLGSVRYWEQRKRRPEGAARVLLTVIEKEPEVVTRALAGDHAAGGADLSDPPDHGHASTPSDNQRET
jgi:putative transcriptional regulator